MFMRFVSTAKIRLSPALILLSGAVLSGCVMDGAGDFTDPARTAYYERYPIAVRKAPVSMGVAQKGGVLQPDQINAVATFARDARYDSVSRVNIRWPSGSAQGRQAANDAASVMVSQGIPPGAISVGSYPAGRASPLKLGYERKVAVTKECGDWSDNLANSPLNDSYQNFGCAYQQNVAAMVADAEDFEHPRAESPIVAANRVTAMAIYFGSATDVKSTSATTSQTNDQTKTQNNGGTAGN